MAYLYDLTDTWNAAGTVFNAIKMNVTNTASAAGSKIVALQVGSTDRFTVDKDGNGYFSGTLQAVGGISLPNVYIGANAGTIGMQDNTASILAYNGTGSGGITNTLRFITGAAERVRIDGSGNVGIGTSSPGTKLDVSGNVRLSAANATVELTSGGPQIYCTAANTLQFATGGGIGTPTERMRLDANGNLGIGTSSPGYKLTVSGGATSLAANQYLRFGAAPFAAGDGSVTNYLFSGSTSMTWRNAADSADLMYLSNSGNLGIGTSSPGSKLEVKSTTTNTARIRVTGTGSTAGNYRGYEFANASGFSGGIFQDESTSNIQFWNYGAATMTLTESGNLGLGVTPSAWYTGLGLKALQVGEAALVNQTNGYSWLQRNAFADASNVQKYITNGYATRYQQGDGAHIWQTAPSGTAGNAISFTQAMTLDASGNLGIGTSSPANILDIRRDTSGTQLRVSTSDNGNILYAGWATGASYVEAAGYNSPALAFKTGGTERMRIDASGNVGIGTSSPASKLNVSGGNVTVSAGYGIAFSGDQTRIMTPEDNVSGALINWASAGICRFVGGTTERMRIDSSGNVGIGTTPSATTRLHVAAPNTAGNDNTGNVYIATTDAQAADVGGKLTFGGFYNGASTYAFGGIAGRKENSTSNNVAGYLQLLTTSSAGALTERMRIDSSGNVGIGTSSPANIGAGQTTLDIGAASGKTANLYLHANGTSGISTGFVLQQDAGLNGYVWNYSNAPVIFATNNTERARINSSGDVLVNTSTTFGKLSVYGTTGFNADANAAIPGSGSHKFRGTAGGTTITTYDYLNYTAVQFIRDNGNPTNTVGSITCTDGSTSYNTSSDRRLKKDIVPAGDAGSVIDAIEIVSHGWKASEGTVPFGVIAQDLHAVAPQAVHAGDDGEEVSDVWGVDYSKLVPMLIKEIQSLRARVAQLEGN